MPTAINIAFTRQILAPSLLRRLQALQKVDRLHLHPPSLEAHAKETRKKQQGQAVVMSGRRQRQQGTDPTQGAPRLEGRKKAHPKVPMMVELGRTSKAPGDVNEAKVCLRLADKEHLMPLPARPQRHAQEVAQNPGTVHLPRAGAEGSRRLGAEADTEGGAENQQGAGESRHLFRAALL